MTRDDPYWDFCEPDEASWDDYRQEVLGGRPDCPSLTELIEHGQGRCGAARSRQIEAHLAQGCGYCEACLQGVSEARSEGEPGLSPVPGSWLAAVRGQSPEATGGTKPPASSDTRVPGVSPARGVGSADTRMPGDTSVPGRRAPAAVLRPFAPHLLAEAVGEEHAGLAEALVEYVAAREGLSLPTTQALLRSWVAEFAVSRGLAVRGGLAVERAVARYLRAESADADVRSFWQLALDRDKAQPNALARLRRSDPRLSAAIREESVPDLADELAAAVKRLVADANSPAAATVEAG